jgi:hypothetical protein
MFKYCPVTGVNIKNFIIALIFGFAFLFVFDMILHGNILIALYDQTPELWRTPDDMMANFYFTLLTEFLTVFTTLLVFTRHFEKKGIAEGVRFGILIGLVLAVQMAAPYGWLTISPLLAFGWFVGGIAQGIALGMIYAVFYRQ